MDDKRDKLKEKPFSYTKTKDGTALVYWKARLILTLSGKQYARLLVEEGKADEVGLQLFLAKVTGNFKHGNERR